MTPAQMQRRRARLRFLLVAADDGLKSFILFLLFRQNWLMLLFIFPSQGGLMLIGCLPV